MGERRSDGERRGEAGVGGEERGDAISIESYRYEMVIPV